MDFTIKKLNRFTSNAGNRKTYTRGARISLSTIISRYYTRYNKAYPAGGDSVSDRSDISDEGVRDGVGAGGSDAREGKIPKPSMTNKKVSVKKSIGGKP